MELSPIGSKILIHIKGQRDPGSITTTYGIWNIYVQLIDPRLKMKIYLDSDLLPAHELGMALRQPDTALQQPHRGSGLQQITKNIFFCLV
jgi:hypothetical protein